MDNKVSQLLKSFWISLGLFVVFIFILMLGFLPGKKIVDTFLIASVMYVAFVLFWFISRLDGFTILRKVKKSVMNTIRSKETKEYYNKEETKGSSIGLYVSLSLSCMLLAISATIDVL